MFFAAVGKGGWDNIYTIVKNGEAVALYSGTPVCYDLAVKDGSVLIPVTADFQVPAGVIAEGVTLAVSGGDKDWGAALVRGWHTGIYMFGNTVTAGAQMILVTGKSYISLATTFAHANSIGEGGAIMNIVVIAGSSGCYIATSTFGNKYVGWVRCMGY